MKCRVLTDPTCDCAMCSLTRITEEEGLYIAEFRDNTAHDLMAPGGPLCACGKPSTHESGWCGTPHTPCDPEICAADCPGLCSTCNEPYSMPPTFRAMLCSNGFHCCRDCTWKEGRVVKECLYHHDV
jgi:hypothetical protein